ncbi:MAG: precorrin-6Y C5,15-methyltransferase (decarboxylating) subunit CbiT [Lachnoclostridium edouardi]|uniref:precorrin-6Y C5,15-methyltransferase (decarboxylating) subunit CbiT n=1 Tax=Lachnoclostridium edouardi TaxID=1926283 RepID=UPI0026DAD669|nr:precorrin-6Y C5,15-methyltransferase (decarboxylating) subunit CbiT [Lachnoclostridium edouardi]MDO4279165.1 precorrin-6Y C5,15-methyltransferase (decarboxylating) subunit CbiT [Lachnoclostridium edouardi]
MRDQEFIRGKVPMTKAEVRAVSISKLELKKDSVLWDVGAGTGSVSVEAAGFMPKGAVYAVEKKPEALELIKKNIEKFQADCVHPVEGEAPKVLEGLPAPTHVFLGGTGGNLEEILDLVLKVNSEARIVANVIALESLARIIEYIKLKKLQGEIICMQVSKGELLGEYHLMKGQNPVYIITLNEEKKDD